MSRLPRAMLLALCLAVAACGGKSGSAGDPAERVYQHCMDDLKRSVGSGGGAHASPLIDMEQLGKQVCEKARDACRQNPGTSACQ